MVSFFPFQTSQSLFLTASDPTNGGGAPSRGLAPLHWTQSTSRPAPQQPGSLKGDERGYIYFGWKAPVVPLTGTPRSEEASAVRCHHLAGRVLVSRRQQAVRAGAAESSRALPSTRPTTHRNCVRRVPFHLSGLLSRCRLTSPRLCHPRPAS